MGNRLRPTRRCGKRLSGFRSWASSRGGRRVLLRRAAGAQCAGRLTGLRAAGGCRGSFGG
ncbi:MAG: 50S ribosomal protein L34 [Phycisphaerae bacterium]|nr:50S ribosomal protein L34 [Phycisphaerae bacterium]